MSFAPIYTLTAQDVFSTLETSPRGLTAAEADSRLSLYGANSLNDQKPASFKIGRLFSLLTHPMAILLWGAGLIAAFGGRPLLAIVMWGVVIINAVFSFFQEHRAEVAQSSLEDLLPEFARVMRMGGEAALSTSGIVPGDILMLAEGDNIPADARIVEEFGLRVNNASLTGESIPARKTAAPSYREDLTELEQPNLVFAGTSVASGTARAVVYSTGSLTEFGRIARLTRDVEEHPSRLQEELNSITRAFTIIALVFGAGVFGVGVLQLGIPWLIAFLLAIGIIVATIPEGLVPTLTLTLAIAVTRLSKRGVLVKKLSIMETLGMTSVICTDKSGTLTQNQMTVREVWLGGCAFHVSGVGYAPKGEFSPAVCGNSQHNDMQLLLTAAMLCNNSRLIPKSPERPKWTCLGDQTEAALKTLAIKGGIAEEKIAEQYPRLHEIPFDARRKRMSTIHPSESGELVFTKGAPREVLRLCNRIRIGGEDLPLTEKHRQEILSANDRYACGALRVLAIAFRILPHRAHGGAAYPPENVERDLTFLGLTAMMDPPRPEVAAAVQKCRGAGIRLVMITGDYGLTADSLARRIGMLSSPSPRILTGAELDQMSDPQLQVALEEEMIFSRMAPEHKLRLVAAYQKRGETVAVIGDGVNDAPALRKANIGISMGVSGTDVARDSADVILTNDNFGAVADAIEEGRAVFSNLQKFITYILSSNVPELVPIIITAVFNIPLALTVVQILAIDLGTDLLPGLALGMEKPEPDIMQRPPRKPDQPLLDRFVLVRSIWIGLIEAALCYAGFLFVYYWSNPAGWTSDFNPIWLSFSELLRSTGGRTYILATTMYHAGVVAAQVGNAFACRTSYSRIRQLGFFSNRFLWATIAVSILVMILIIYFEPLAILFEHLPLPLELLLPLAGFPVVVYLLEKIRKSIFRSGFLLGKNSVQKADSRSEPG